jgi:hypothetical protein
LALPGLYVAANEPQPHSDMGRFHEMFPHILDGKTVGFVIAFIIGVVAWFVGAVLLGAPFIRGRVRPRWVGYVLAASALWVVVGDLVIAPSGPATNLALNLLSNLAPVLLLVGGGYLGFRVWAEHAPARHTEPSINR